MSAPFRIVGHRLEDGVFRATYAAEVLGEPAEFIEIVDFRGIPAVREPDPAFLRLLALLASVSYYKATPSTGISVEFPVAEADLALLAAVIHRGMGEYASVHDLPGKLHPEITTQAGIVAAPTTPTPPPAGPALVPIGGGRDSLVTLEALRSAGLPLTLFSVNGRGAIHDCAAAAGLDYLEAHRTLDPGLIRLNARGALNGHVPVTGINSAIALLAAELGGLGPVVFSNERSAEYGNVAWDGQEINHQWSKSLEFEDLLRGWLDANGLGADRYFSLLRRFDELDMARLFARLDRYFPVFSSCNRAYVSTATAATPKWCGACAKCNFVFLTLAPFVGRETLLGIFGRDVLDDPANLGLVRDIVGLGSLKPFDCVGEPAEAAVALARLADAPEWQGSRIVAELAPGVRGASLERPRATGDRVPTRFAPARDALLAALA